MKPSATASKPTSTARRPQPSPASSARRSPAKRSPSSTTAACPTAAAHQLDDEGNPTQENVLIENGILKGYLSDKLSSRLMGTPNTGSGRRESYHHIPMPRMTNTYMLNGDDLPEDIIKSVKRGLYAVNFGGGQVDITNGKFVFSASEAYLIEDGKVTRPVKGATLIGNGPEALKYVSMVGNDLALDEGIGTCGKAGQSVPVGVGMPTVRLDRMTVGGTGTFPFSNGRGHATMAALCGSDHGSFLVAVSYCCWGRPASQRRSTRSNSFPRTVLLRLDR
jgi:hypothetical protein